MSVISFASLKGGVGKTSLSLNVAHAFALQGNRVLLIDSDPAAHASRFFKHEGINQSIEDSTLGRLFFSLRTRLRDEEDIDLLEAAEEFQIPLFFDVRENLAVLPGSSQLHHFLWGPGARVYKKLFPKLMAELTSVFDIVVFDTCPDYNLITRNIIAHSDLVVVPVDASEMSIASLEEIFRSSAHIQGPAWAIVRSMVSRQATRVRKLSENRLSASEQLHLKDANEHQDESGEEEEFIDMLKEVESCGLSPEEIVEQGLVPGADNSAGDDREIFLLRTTISRTEQQNRLSFVGKTSFDNRETKKLALEYKNVAKEMETVLSFSSSDLDSAPDAALGSLMSSAASDAEEAGY